MALDEALLESADRVTIRFYDWAQPALSFGYFGKFADVQGHADTRDIVRRWTGGGIVFHGDDLTYAIIIPAPHAPSRVLYQEIHLAIISALRSGGIVAALTAGSHAKISDACFSNPVRADVMRGDVKIAGAAHRRTRNGLLHQGSIQVGGLKEEFPARFAAELAPTLTTQAISDEVTRRAAQIATQKYATDTWNCRR